jgi:hypothetical protein
LNRYWRDLGNQIAGSPDTLRRLPAVIADLAEGLWEQALSVAVDATGRELRGRGAAVLAEKPA